MKIEPVYPNVPPDRLTLTALLWEVDYADIEVIESLMNSFNVAGMLEAEQGAKDILGYFKTEREKRT